MSVIRLTFWLKNYLSRNLPILWFVLTGNMNRQYCLLIGWQCQIPDLNRAIRFDSRAQITNGYKGSTERKRKIIGTTGLKDGLWTSTLIAFDNSCDITKALLQLTDASFVKCTLKNVIPVGLDIHRKQSIIFVTWLWKSWHWKCVI